MMFRDTLCAWRDCPNLATHVLRLLVPVTGLPFDRRKPLEALVSVEVCAAHDDKAEFLTVIKGSGLLAALNAVCRAQGIAPVDTSRAVVRLVRKEDGESLQYPSR